MTAHKRYVITRMLWGLILALLIFMIIGISENRRFWKQIDQQNSNSTK